MGLIFQNNNNLPPLFSFSLFPFFFFSSPFFPSFPQVLKNGLKSDDALNCAATFAVDVLTADGGPAPWAGLAAACLHAGESAARVLQFPSLSTPTIIK